MSSAKSSKVPACGKGPTDNVVVAEVDVANIVENIVAEGVAATVATGAEGKSRENGVDASLPNNGCSDKANAVHTVDQKMESKRDACIQPKSCDVTESCGMKEIEKEKGKLPIPPPLPLPSTTDTRTKTLAFKCFVTDSEGPEDLSISSTLKRRPLQPHVLAWAKSRLKSVPVSTRTPIIKVRGKREL